jgi:hypothetical protein
VVIISCLKSYFLVIVPKDLYFPLEYIIEIIIIFYTIVCIKLYDINSKFIIR